MRTDWHRWCVCIWLALIIYALVSPHHTAATQEDPHENLGELADSHTCLECHDGALAQDVVSHPIGMDYATSFFQRQGTLKPIGTLPSSIRLEEGRVGCASCHDTASSLPAKLALSNAGSALCFACHNL
ncbi:MAG: cytochrome c3 family protein [Dehalococcoidia bacterium]